MIPHILTQINWVDVLVVIVLFRISYIASKTGLPVEIFKFLGTVSAVYFSLHYYVTFADMIWKRLPAVRIMPLEFMDFLCFLIMAIFGYLVFLSLRLVFYRFMKMEAVPALSKWGGLVLGLARGFLFTGLLLFALVISSFNYPKESVINSYSGKRVLKIAPNTYTWLWENIFSKFMAGEKFNKTVLQAQGSVK